MEDEIRLPSPAAVADLAGRELSELDRLARLDGLVTALTEEAQAYVGDLHRLRRATILDVVNCDGWEDEAARRHALRIQQIAERLSISPTQVYHAIKRARAERHA